jgi:hypothetical protein
MTLFKHTMIAFSAVFLLKVAWNWSSVSLNIDKRQVLDLVRAVVEMMSGAQASRRHLCHHIATGLSKMVTKLENRPSLQQRNEARDTMIFSSAIDGIPYNSMSSTDPDVFGPEEDWLFNTSIDPFCFSIT